MRLCKQKIYKEITKNVPWYVCVVTKIRSDSYIHGLKVTNAPRSDRRAPRVNLHPNEHIRAYGVGGDKMFYKGRFAPLKKNMVKLSYKYYLEFKFSSLCSLS